MEETKLKLEQIKDILASLNDTILQSHLIQDNKYTFNFQDKLYRVKMPSQRDKVNANDIMNKLYMKLINENMKLPENERHKTRVQLKQALKDSGLIDIAQLEKNKADLYKELNNLYNELAQVLSENIETIKQYEQKIIPIRDEFQKVSITIANYLQASIEDRKEKVYYEYLTYTCTEYLENNNWVKVWNQFEDYQNETSGLEDKAAEGMIALLMNTQG